MTSLRDHAKAYKAPATIERKNIVDLKIVRIDADIKTNVVAEGTEKEFTTHELEQDGIVYRVPVSVFAQLQGILEARPDVAAVKVTKTGTGMGTSYQVIPL